jgi:hypothetical protein
MIASGNLKKINEVSNTPSSDEGATIRKSMK